jgi:hypothetical protein
VASETILQLAERLEDYWSDRPAGKKPKDTFGFSQERLDEHIAKTCRDFFHVNGVRAVSLVEAVWHFVDYLAAHSRIEGEKAKRIREMCRRLFDLSLRVVDSTDPAPDARISGDGVSEEMRMNNGQYAPFIHELKGGKIG